MEIGSFSAFKVATSEKVDPGQTWTDELHHNGLKIILKGQLISKWFFEVVDSLQKTNENNSHSSKNEFIRSFFGGKR